MVKRGRPSNKVLKHRERNKIYKRRKDAEKKAALNKIPTIKTKKLRSLKSKDNELLVLAYNAKKSMDAMKTDSKNKKAFLDELIINLKRSKNIKKTEIAAALGVSVSKVFRTKNIRSKIQPDKFTEEEKNFIINQGSLQTDQGGSLRSIQKAFKGKFGKEISTATVFRTLKKKYGKPYKKRKILFLTDVHKKDRLNFCKTAKEKYFNLDILFSDEKAFYLIKKPHPQNTRIRLTQEEVKAKKMNDPKVLKKLEVQIAKDQSKLMIAGGICGDGKTKLFFLIGSVDKYLYGVLLRQYINYIKDFSNEQNKKMILMQDRATVHFSEINIDLLKQENVEFFDWPPNSPDLNPIENLWSVLAQRAPQEFSNKLEFIKKLCFVWENLEENLLKNLILSWPERVNACIEAEGNNFIKKKSKEKLSLIPNDQNYIALDGYCHIIYDIKNQNSVKKNHVTLINKYLRYVQELNEKTANRKKIEAHGIKNKKDIETAFKKVEKANLIKAVCLKKLIKLANILDYHKSIDEFERSQIFFEKKLPKRFQMMFEITDYRFNFLEIQQKINATKALCKRNPYYYFIYPSEDSDEIFALFLFSIFPDLLQVTTSKFLKTVYKLNEFAIKNVISKTAKLAEVKKKPNNYEDIVYAGYTQKNIKDYNAHLYIYFDGKEYVRPEKIIDFNVKNISFVIDKVNVLEIKQDPGDLPTQDESFDSKEDFIFKEELNAEEDFNNFINLKNKKPNSESKISKRLNNINEDEEIKVRNSNNNFNKINFDFEKNWLGNLNVTNFNQKSQDPFEKDMSLKERLNKKNKNQNQNQVTNDIINFFEENENIFDDL